ncbi:MAG: hypothetical protein HY738_13180 [Bacteroidia bacterium]|nr:hypothetical protein [Bacteroidia bacterium]
MKNKLKKIVNGFLWIATFDGLARFGGNEFRVFKPSDYNNSISNRISHLFEDRYGQLWIITEDRVLLKYEHENVELAGIPEDSAIKISAFCAYPDGSLFLVAGNKFYKRQQDFFQQYKIPCTEQVLVLRQFNFKTSQVLETCEVWIKKLFSMFHF